MSNLKQCFSLSFSFTGLLLLFSVGINQFVSYRISVEILFIPVFGQHCDLFRTMEWAFWVFDSIDLNNVQSEVPPIGLKSSLCARCIQLAPRYSYKRWHQHFLLGTSAFKVQIILTTLASGKMCLKRVKIAWYDGKLEYLNRMSPLQLTKYLF